MSSRVEKLMQVNTLNLLCQQLNDINDQYPRYIGSMVMVSDDTEDRIEGILNGMSELVEGVSEFTDDEIGELFEDVPGYREFLASLKDIIKANREEVARAREFLARYHAI